MKIKILLLSSFLILLLSPVSVVRGEDEDTVEGEEEANVEDEPVEGEKPDSVSATEKDLEDEEDVTKLEPSPDVETVMVFTHPTDNKDLPAGKLVKYLVGFFNKGEKDFTVESMEASFRYPMDHTFYIQNYTAARFNKLVEPGQEVTLDYAFVPSEGFSARPFLLVVNLNYKDADGKVYQNAVFNQTVNIVEDESGFNPETGFLYVIFACVVILLLLLGQQMLSKMRRKHGIKPKREVPVEIGTSNKHEVDFEWIPKEILNHANKSPKVGGSPRNRKARRAGGDS